MTIIDSREESLETNKDVKRHHEKVREAVKQKLPEILSEENIITSDNKGRKIRVPIKSIEIPDLRRGKRNKDKDGDGDGGQAGVGQGSGKKGDVLGKRPAQGKGEGNEPGKPGSDPGEDMIEGEFTIEEIIDMMMEDLGLPNLSKKDLATIEVNLGYKIAGSEKNGPMVLLKRRPTAKNAMKTFWVCMTMLSEKYKERTELDCYAALKITGGSIHESETLLEDPNFSHDFKTIDPFPIIGNDDLRFFNVEEKKTSETNAVIFAILDVSGSMSDMKKYIARAILFWMVQILRKQYTNVEIRFIVHHTTARLVEEKDFFRTEESGGTIGHTAFSLANDLIKEKYPTDLWNVYTFYFSDGDDFEPDRTVAEIKKMIDSGINLFGFANIKYEFEEIHNVFSRTSHWKGLMDIIVADWPVSVEEVDTVEGDEEVEIITGQQGFPFLAATINDKKHVFVVLREFLRKNRG